MNCSCSKPLAQTPTMKPNRQKVVDVSTRNAIIHSGWLMLTGTNRFAVARMISPSSTDLVAAAPT